MAVKPRRNRYVAEQKSDAVDDSDTDGIRILSGLAIHRDTSERIAATRVLNFQATISFVKQANSLSNQFAGFLCTTAPYSRTSH